MQKVSGTQSAQNHIGKHVVKFLNLIQIYTFIQVPPGHAFEAKPISQLQGHNKKNAAKWSRQYAGKKYREYAQRRVSFVNEQVP